MAASSRVPGVIKTVRILGIVQAGVWITATMWVIIDTIAQPAGPPHLPWVTLPASWSPCS